MSFNEGAPKSNQSSCTIVQGHGAKFCQNEKERIIILHLYIYSDTYTYMFLCCIKFTSDSDVIILLPQVRDKHVLNWCLFSAVLLRLQLSLNNLKTNEHNTIN